VGGAQWAFKEGEDEGTAIVEEMATANGYKTHEQA